MTTYPIQLMMDPAVLEPNPWNTNILTPEAEVKLEASLRRLSFFKPAVVREIVNSSNNEIIYQILGGAHRVEIAVRIGLPTIPVVNLGPIDDLKAKEVGIVDNSRYGLDDTLAFAELIKEMGNSGELKDFLPYTEMDFADLFASVEIDLDDLGLDDEPEQNQAATQQEEIQPKAAKTHTVIRFKLSIKDAERITKAIEQTKRDHGYTASDDLTNAGDALSHIIFGTPGVIATAQITDPDEQKASLWGLEDMDEPTGDYE